MDDRSVVFCVRTGSGGVLWDGTFTDVVEVVSRIPRTHAGWDSVKYHGKRYQLHGGARSNWFINLLNPIKKRPN